MSTVTVLSPAAGLGQRGPRAMPGRNRAAFTKLSTLATALTCTPSVASGRKRSRRTGRCGACGPLPLTNPVVYKSRFQTYPPVERQRPVSADDVSAGSPSTVAATLETSAASGCWASEQPARWGLTSDPGRVRALRCWCAPRFRTAD